LNIGRSQSNDFEDHSSIWRGFVRKLPPRLCHPFTRCRMVNDMKYKVPIIFMIFSCAFLPSKTVLAQDTSYVTQDTTVTPGTVEGDTTSSKPRMSVAPMITFGIAGFVVGYVVGHKIDPGSQPPGEFSLSLTAGEKTGMLAGLATGVSIGYILAKRDQRREQEEREAIEQERKNKTCRRGARPANSTPKCSGREARFQTALGSRSASHPAFVVGHPDRGGPRPR